MNRRRDFPLYPEEYPAVYTDARGSEKIVVHNDGEELHMRVRRVDFRGCSFDDWEPAEHTSPELLAQFTLDERHGELREFTLTCEIPVPIAQEKDDAGELMGTLTMHLELGRATPNGGADLEQLNLTLGGEGLEPVQSIPNKDAFFEIALNDIHERLPPTRFIKTCINCDFSDYSPYGQGLFGPHMACFRGIKAKYRAVESKQDLFRIWDEMTEFVGELHLCADFVKRMPGRGYRG